MYIYDVTVEPHDGIAPGAFQGIGLGEDGYIEHCGWNDDGTEDYEVYSEYPIDRRLDAGEGVVSWQARAVDGNEAWDGAGNEE